MPPKEDAKRKKVDGQTDSGDASATESDSSVWNGEGPDASCNEGSKFVPASSGPGTSPRQQWPPTASSAESAQSEMDVMSMSFEEQNDKARLRDLEGQLRSVSTANIKLQSLVADREMHWQKASEDMMARMAEAQSRIVELEAQLRAAHDEMAVIQVRLEASETHSLAGFRHLFCYVAVNKARSPRLQSISASQASCRFIKNRPAAVALAKEKPASNGVSLVVGHVMTATSGLPAQASAQVQLIKPSVRLMPPTHQRNDVAKWLKQCAPCQLKKTLVGKAKCPSVIKYVSVIETSAFFASSNRRGQHSSFFRDAAVDVRTLRLALIERRYGAINGRLSNDSPLHDVRARQVDSTRLGARRLVEEGVQQAVRTSTPPIPRLQKLV